MLYNALQNKEEASRYFKKAADKGNVESMLKYSHGLNNADGIDSNKDEAVTYIKIAVDKDDPEAFSIYGHLLQSGEVEMSDEKDAAFYYKKISRSRKFKWNQQLFFIN